MRDLEMLNQHEKIFDYEIQSILKLLVISLVS